MRIDLAGFGPGSMELVTGQLKEVLSLAEAVITSARLASVLRDEQEYEAGGEVLLRRDVRIFEETGSARICELLEELSESGTCGSALCLFGGDSSFYSGAAPVLKRIRESGILADDAQQIRLFPGISSLSAACARLKLSMQDIAVFSAHGRACDPVRAVMSQKISFFLTGGKTGPADLCRELVKAGLGDLEVTVCEMLFTKEERIRKMTAAAASGEICLPLSVMLASPAPVSEHLRRSIPGIEDEAFARGSVPMTKRFVRVCALSLLAPSEEELCWDLGAGTGSVSIEMCALCRRVISVEKNPDAVLLLEENRKRFGAWNMQITKEDISEAAAKLPLPDAVYLGGGGVKLADVLCALKVRIDEWNDCKGERIRPKMPRIVAPAVTLETLQGVRQVLDDFGYDVQIVQIAVTDVKQRGSYHMMDAQNPVFLIFGKMTE